MPDRYVPAQIIFDGLERHPVGLQLAHKRARRGVHESRRVVQSCFVPPSGTEVATHAQRLRVFA